jgi:predicted dehydrogenase
MKVNLIIGAGQLGSRHLQALLRLNLEQQIYVLDPSVSSLKIAKARASEIVNSHTINFITDWEDLPAVFDLAIVATGANVRSKIIKQLLTFYVVKYLVLEKVLFQDIASYEEIRLLLLEKQTPTWVNHPRRMFSHYQAIKNTLAETDEPVFFNVVGGNWGLACNAIHFIDLFTFLSGSTVTSLNFDWIDDIIHESKRPGNIEFTGTISGSFKNEDRFGITSFNGEISDITVHISTISNRWLIQEGSSQNVIHLSKENAFKAVMNTFETEFQSTLTTEIAQSIFETGNCKLPTYEEACLSHIPFLTSSLKKYVLLTGFVTDLCPIT